jgi:hypothetical protein
VFLSGSGISEVAGRAACAGWQLACCQVGQLELVESPCSFFQGLLVPTHYSTGSAACLRGSLTDTPTYTCCRRDPDAWTHADGRAHYTVSSPVPASPQLVQQLLAACSDQV